MKKVTPRLADKLIRTGQRVTFRNVEYREEFSCVVVDRDRNTIRTSEGGVFERRDLVLLEDDDLPKPPKVERLVRITERVGDRVLSWALDGDQETFTGGFNGGHGILTGDLERAKSHWSGYVENNRREWLKSQLAKLSPERHQEVREAYYKAAEGLSALLSATEFADLDLHAEQGNEAGPLIVEHLQACEAYDAFKKLDLGRFV